MMDISQTLLTQMMPTVITTIKDSGVI